jgi:hypothetical protein
VSKKLLHPKHRAEDAVFIENSNYETKCPWYLAINRDQGYETSYT